MSIAANRHDRRNEEIEAHELRLINAEGEQVGVVSREDALAQAQEAGLDLVEIVPHAEPPVAKIMDYGKHIFQRSKTKQAGKKKQKQVQVKEVKFRPGTEIGDYNTKMRHLVKFLEEGDKVKVTLRFRGREMAHQELGLELLERVKADLAEISSVEQEPASEGRQMVMVLAPEKAAPATGKKAKE